MDSNKRDTQTELNEGDRLISFANARLLAGISRSTIYFLLTRDSFPQPVKIGRNNYFSEREIRDWIQEKLKQRPQVTRTKY